MFGFSFVLWFQIWKEKLNNVGLEQFNIWPNFLCSLFSFTSLFSACNVSSQVFFSVYLSEFSFFSFFHPASSFIFSNFPNLKHSFLFLTCLSIPPPVLLHFLSCFISNVSCLSCLTSISVYLHSTRSVQSQVDEVWGPFARPSPAACPGTGGTRQTAHLQQICVQHQSGGEKGHSGWQQPHCRHWRHSGLSGSLE